MSDSAPFIHSPFHTRRMMVDVLLALLPGLLVGFWRFGIRGIFLAAVCVACALACEGLYTLATQKPATLADGSAALTGLLLAMTLPPSCPAWVGALGSAFAILAVKCPWGGLGENLCNPALAGRAMLVLVFPQAVTRYETDGISAATPLHRMAMGDLPEESLPSLLLGNCSGSLGEISALALILGGVYLVLRRVISPRIPLSYLAALAVLSFLFPRAGGRLSWMASQLLSGGVMLGAIFMATDYTTSPVTPSGQWLYGAGCGMLTLLFRYYGLFPEGVSYAILTMNLLTWVIDRHTLPRRFGRGREEKP